MIKVLTINWSISDGSIAKLIKDIENENTEECEFYHCYQVGAPSHDRQFRVAGWNITRFYYLWARMIGLKYGVGTIPTLRLVHHIKRMKPDIVHIHCPNFYNINLYYLLNCLKKAHMHVVITNHAEFFYTGNCAHAEECTGYLSGCHNCKRVFDVCHRYWRNRTETEWKRMKKSFQSFPTMQMTAVSPWVKKRYETSPIVKGIPITVIENAVDTDIYHKMDITAAEFSDKFQGKKVILNVTSGFSDLKDDLKGGYYFIQLAQRLKQHAFVVAGNAIIHHKENIPDNLLFLGNIIDKTILAQWYNRADVTVVTSKRETFGMTCAESLACGTPVVGFFSGGTESIAIEEYTEFVEFGNVDELAETICRWLDKKAECSMEMAKRAGEKYSVKRMGKEYLELYKQILENEG